jgi:hypothetical protein
VTLPKNNSKWKTTTRETAMALRKSRLWESWVGRLVVSCIVSLKLALQWPFETLINN